MAMAVWGTNRHYRWREIRRSHFEQTAAACGLGGSVRPLVEALLERTPEVVRQVSAAIPDGFPAGVSAPILDGLQQAARRLRGEV